MKPGRFVIDAHIHAQRFAAGPKLKESGVLELTGGAQWEALGEAILDLIPYDNSARLLTDMEAYGIDACVLLPAFGMSNEINADLVQRYFRDAATYWSHNTPSQSDALARRLAMIHLGIPLELEFGGQPPATGA